MTSNPVTRRNIAQIAAAAALGASASVASARAPGPVENGHARPSRLQPPADDRLEIIELMARYAWAYDTQDARGLASTFTPEGELIVFGNVLISGHGDIPAFLEQAALMRGDHGWQHLTDHHLFRDYDGQRCAVYSYYTMPESDAQGGNVNMRAMGYYVSDCLRTESGWKFARRAVFRWNGQAPVAL